MKNSNTRRLVLAGLLTAFGLLLPFVTSHAFGIQGTVLLPMHLPVFLLGLLCGPFYGAAGGLVIPLLSSLVTGMPPVFPMLPIMAGELFTYGLLSGLFYRKRKLPLIPALLISMTGGRLVYGLIFGILAAAGNGPLKALSMPYAFLEGLPGIAVQLIVLPVLIKAAERLQRQGYGSGAETAASMQKARNLIKDKEVSCVVIKNGEIVHTTDGRGVAPLLALLEEQPSLLTDAVVVDKIIGKAAAMLLVYGGAKEAFGETMSRSALDWLAGKGIRTGYGRCIDVISNRTGDGICPLEKAVKDVEEPAKAYGILKETAAALKKASRVS